MPFRILVIVIAEIGAAIGAVIVPFWGLLALLFITFSRPQDDRPNVVALHIPLVLIASIGVGTLSRLAVVAPAFWAGVKRLRIILVFFALMVVSALASFTELAQSRLDDFTTVLCLCLLTLGWVTTEKRLQAYVAALIAAGAYIVQVGLRHPRQMVEEIGDQTFSRLTFGTSNSMFGHPNYLALFMVMLIFLCITLMGYYRAAWQRAALLALAGCSGYLFFRASSRGASIALAVGLMVLWLMQRSKIKSAVLALVLLGLGSLLAPHEYWQRLATVHNYQEDASATSRLELWDIALRLISEHPVLGVGPDNFTLYASNTPHDAYLQVGAEMGVPAMFVYVAVLISGLYSAWRARRLSTPEAGGSVYIHALSLGIFVSVIAIVVQGFTTGLAHREFVYVFVTMAYCVRNLAERPAAGAEEEDVASEHASLESAV